MRKDVVYGKINSCDDSWLRLRQFKLALRLITGRHTPVICIKFDQSCTWICYLIMRKVFYTYRIIQLGLPCQVHIVQMSSEHSKVILMTWVRICFIGAIPRFLSWCPAPNRRSFAEWRSKVVHKQGPGIRWLRSCPQLGLLLLIESRIPEAFSSYLAASSQVCIFFFFRF